MSMANFMQNFNHTKYLTIMKRINLIGYLMIILSSFLFIQCTSDPIAGPAGTDGTNGIDGTDGVDGVGVQECIACHSDTHRDGINDAYLTAKHATGTSWAYAGTREDCAACHNNEGFIDYIETGGVAVGGYNIANPLNCNGCHDKHRSFDFAEDGNDMAVRTLDAVDFRVFAEDDTLDDYVLDYGNASNLCANCHQPRTGIPKADENGKYKNTSTHWGPHHGPQTALLEGLLGAYTTFTIYEAIPAVKEAKHRTDTGACVDCHMEGTTDGSYGHTWEPALNNCSNCHTTPADQLEVTGLADDMTTLAGLLEQVKGEALDSNNDPISGSEVVGIVHDDHPVKGYFDIKAAEAAWNYLYILEDKSMGIHNPNYAKSIIKNSVANLQDYLNNQ